jgi:hypothetical protein
VGYRLRPNKVDMTDSTSSQKIEVGYPMPGTAPPLSDRRKGVDYLKGIPRGNRPRRMGTENLQGTKQQTKATGFEGATSSETQLTRLDDTSHALQLEGSRSLDSKGGPTALGADMPSDKDGLHKTPPHMG